MAALRGMADAAAGLPAAAAAAGGGGGTVALLAAGASQRLAVLPEGGPHSWGAIVLAFWLVWLCMQGEQQVVVGLAGAALLLPLGCRRACRKCQPNSSPVIRAA